MGFARGAEGNEGTNAKEAQDILDSDIGFFEGVGVGGGSNSPTTDAFLADDASASRVDLLSCLGGMVCGGGVIGRRFGSLFGRMAGARDRKEFQWGVHFI